MFISYVLINAGKAVLEQKAYIWLYNSFSLVDFFNESSLPGLKTGKKKLCVGMSSSDMPNFNILM